MNYGFNTTCELWKEDRKNELVNALEKMINKYNGKLAPYIEVDGLYNGVRIRRITNLKEKERSELVDKAETIYKKIMK